MTNITSPLKLVKRAAERLRAIKIVNSSWSLAFFAGLILAIAVGVNLIVTHRHNQAPSSASVTTTETAPATTAELPVYTPPPEPKAIPLTGSTYFENPIRLANLHFFTDNKTTQQLCNKAKIPVFAYYQVGVTKDEQPIVVATLPTCSLARQIELFALGKAIRYTILAQMDASSTSNVDAYNKSLAKNVVIDDHIKLTDVLFPQNVTIAGQSLASAYSDPANPITQGIGMAGFMSGGLTSIEGSSLGSNATTPLANIKLIGSSGMLDYYQATNDDQSTFKLVQIYGVYNHLFSIPYILYGEIASAPSALKINWSSGANNVSTYFTGGTGCGSNGYVVAKGITKSMLSAVGTTPKGQTVYQLPISNALAKKIFKEDYIPDNAALAKKYRNLTISQFSSQHGYFLVKNDFGEYVLYLNDSLVIHGGCAKPVIYLYPTTTTNVSVSVGAQITKSDPFYGTHGWQNVTTHPDGSLTYQGKYYPSLFWEGYGYGFYPQINSGAIVPTKDASTTVRAQLSAQGLTTNEINDFMTFWQPKLQSITQPYVRLSWLGTTEMNRLAPLHINPAPQTLIRVFLDFQGLDKPYGLPAQHFSTPTRNGFTAVEWGGLLHTGLNN